MTDNVNGVYEQSIYSIDLYYTNQILDTYNELGSRVQSLIYKYIYAKFQKTYTHIDRKKHDSLFQ